MKDTFIYAVEKNGLIENVVVGETEDSEQILSLMLPESLLIRVTEETGNPIIGGEFFDGVFRSQPPFKSWVWSSNKKSWVAPVERPLGPYWWDEINVAWFLIPSE